ncbi:cryptochrome/photolyase family protein [Halomarina ordinaria]|uniref:Cryptochrome/photolyase family protein n=1 Tax=Halomarina ordinaria TaxID=3033939 RepID=A0ABD5U9R8_9EURY|nr:deoxyribodipyrimidine photo-lyase [Halomarina sp. PSRA2]
MLLHWHRCDLRAADNVALAEAADDDVLPVFVFDEAVLAHASPPRVAFMLDALANLRGWYRERGGDLAVGHGDPADVLVDVAAEHGADGVRWNHDYSGLAQRRDDAVRTALEGADLDHRAFHGDLHHEPGSITTNDGDPYSVYTYFWKKWRDREKEGPYDPPADEALVDHAGDDLPTLADLGFDDPDCEVEPAGADAARERLAAFCDGPIYEYAERRDYPAEGCTSRLSAHLRWGTIGVREVYAATEEALSGAADDEARESVEEFQSQLAWREFYTHVLFFNPGVVTENYREYENDIEWRDDDDALRAWKDGETGYPIVDAGMRQLREEGYLHNRVRMIVASFLTKDLLLDWREGYDWFRERLVDHHTGNDNGGWQWAASTGTDAQPYFRIFNPMTQGERYDPDAEYIRRYIPELSDVDPGDVHAWHELETDERETLAPAYPAPVVDHGERREAALAMFERARGESDD